MSEGPLRRDAAIDEPGMVGARWWQDSVVDPVGRRQMLLGILGVGAGVGLAGAALAVCEPTRTTRRSALDLQREYGWSFGATTDGLVFNGVSTEPFDRSRLDRMVKELAPRVAAHRPFYVPTLFEAPTALPRAAPPGNPTPAPSLKQALQPICTNGMNGAFAWAQRYSEALATVPGACLVVDLDGQDAVALAAGASALFDPVFLFDNWPHPHGVVPAHLTLAAAAYYQPLLAQPAPDDSPPMFVLDRRRLSPYRDDAVQFDNRWVARMPSAAALRDLGVKTLFYLAPSRQIPWELDDLSDDLVADAAAGIAIVAVDVSSHSAAAPRSLRDAVAVLGEPYQPAPRRTLFSGGHVGGSRALPEQFGSVPIVVSTFGSRPLGVEWTTPTRSWTSRSGSWNRGWSVGG